MKLRKYIADRPWIWLIVLYLTLTSMTVAFVWIAVKHGAPTVPLENHNDR